MSLDTFFNVDVPVAICLLIFSGLVVAVFSPSGRYEVLLRHMDQAPGRQFAGNCLAAYCYFLAVVTVCGLAFAVNNALGFTACVVFTAATVVVGHFLARRWQRQAPPPRE